MIIFLLQLIHDSCFNNFFKFIDNTNTQIISLNYIGCKINFVIDFSINNNTIRINNNNFKITEIIKKSNIIKFHTFYDINGNTRALDVSLNLMINDEMFSLTFLTSNQSSSLNNLGDLGDFIIEGSLNNNLFTNVNNDYNLKDQIIYQINIL